MRVEDNIPVHVDYTVPQLALKVGVPEPNLYYLVREGFIGADELSAGEFGGGPIRIPGKYVEILLGAKELVEKGKSMPEAIGMMEHRGAILSYGSELRRVFTTGNLNDELVGVLGNMVNDNFILPEERDVLMAELEGRYNEYVKGASREQKIDIRQTSYDARRKIGDLMMNCALLVSVGSHQ